MASGGSGKRSKKKDEPGIGTTLAVGAAAAGIAALLYGAKKLYDYVSEEQPKTIPENNDPSYQPPRENRSRSHQTRSEEPRKATVPKVLTPNMPTVPRTSLADQLSSYYAEYVKVPQHQTRRVEKIVEDVKKQLMESLCENHPDVYVSAHYAEDVQAISVDEVDLMIIVNLRQEMWELDDVSGSPTYYHVQRRDGTAATTYNSCTTASGQLSPALISSSFMESVEKNFCINTPDYQAKPSRNDSLIVLDVNYDADKYLCINLIPAVCLRGVIVLAQQFPQIPDQEAWQESYLSRETQKLHTMDPSTCCHLECLGIMKAIALNHPTNFGVLPPGVYKTLLLQMMEDTPEDDLWRHHSLQEQFVDMLNQLVFCLQARKLPHFYSRQLNILSGIDPEFCDGLVNFILNRIGKEKLQTLLIREFKPRGLSCDI